MAVLNLSPDTSADSVIALLIRTVPNKLIRNNTSAPVKNTAMINTPAKLDPIGALVPHGVGVGVGKGFC